MEYQPSRKRSGDTLLNSDQKRLKESITNQRRYRLRARLCRTCHTTLSQDIGMNYCIPCCTYCTNCNKTFSKTNLRFVLIQLPIYLLYPPRTPPHTLPWKCSCFKKMITQDPSSVWKGLLRVNYHGTDEEIIEELREILSYLDASEEQLKDFRECIITKELKGSLLASIEALFHGVLDVSVKPAKREQ